MSGEFPVPFEVLARSFDVAKGVTA